MKRFFLAALALALALGVGLHPQAARAQSNNASAYPFLNWWGHGQDVRLTVTGIGIGIGTGVAGYYLTKKHGTPPHRPMSVGAAYGATTYACAVVTPMLYTVAVNRPLTYREAYMGIADCIVPFIGSWLVDVYLPHTALYDTVHK